MVMQLEHPSVEQRAAEGKAARTAVPREALGEWDPSRRIERPVNLLLEQAATRVPELVPIRHGRMAASPFAYYRGAALPMAADLALGPRSGLTVQLCGDAHLSNFGGFASPERTMVFDINDFDETLPGPFEWDLKRLAASVEVVARSRGFDEALTRRIVVGGIDHYRQAIRTFARMPHLEVWYSRLDVPTLMQRWGGQVKKKNVRQVEINIARATRRDQIRARSKLTRMVDGELRFVSDPPLLVPVSELLDESNAELLRETIHDAIRGYRRTLAGDRRRLLENYRFVDLARKVVGVGSVGTRAWVALFVGRDQADTLILQVKEAEPSVLERYLPRSPFEQHGQRVVEGQRLMQASSDIFLGWQRSSHGADGRSHDYYLRQLWDWKLSADIDTMPPDVLAAYTQMCSWTLARAHARSGDAVAIGSYLGGSDTFARAVAGFAAAYAQQNEADHREMLAAITGGVLAAATDV